MSDYTSSDLDQLIKHLTRGVLASSEVMFSLSPQIALYTLDQSGKLQPKPPTKYGQIPLIFYEVSTPASGAGSWWLPVCSVPDTPSDLDIWGAWEPLDVSQPSTIVTTAMLRPTNTWCWVPGGSVDENLAPISFLGTVSGQHPTQAPS